MTDIMSMHPQPVGQQLCVVRNHTNGRVDPDARFPAKLREKGLEQECWKPALQELDALTKLDPFHVKLYSIAETTGVMTIFGAGAFILTNVMINKEGSITNWMRNNIVSLVMPIVVVSIFTMIKMYLSNKHRLWFHQSVRDLNAKYFSHYGVSFHWIRGAPTNKNAGGRTTGLIFYECKVIGDSKDSENSAEDSSDSDDTEDSSDSDDTDDDGDAKVIPKAVGYRHPNRVSE